MTDAPRDHRRQDILLYQQGYLEADERAELEAHMRDCAACQATMEKVARFLPALQQALTPKLRSSAELLAAVKAQMAAAERRPARFPFWAAAWLGLAVASAAVAVMVLRPAPPPHRPRSSILNSPHRPGWDVDAGSDAGDDDDDGPDVDSGDITP